MNPAIGITQKQLPEFLLHVAPSRPVFILGQPGIGKTSLVRQFAELVGLPCVGLLGTQLAPEDLIGVPESRDGTSRFCPPSLLVPKEPFCLFLDELNGPSPEVQKAPAATESTRRGGVYPEAAARWIDRDALHADRCHRQPFHDQDAWPCQVYPNILLHDR